jgi:hypothetical protein
MLGLAGNGDASVVAIDDPLHEAQAKSGASGVG